MISSVRFVQRIGALLVLALWTIAARADGLFVPASERVDIMPDSGRHLLYISTGSGSVLRYDWTAQTFLSPFALGGNLRGMDISPDGKTLAVADIQRQDSNVPLHLVDLNTGVARQITFTRESLEGGTFSVAFASNNKLLCTSTFEGSGWVPLHSVDLGTGTAKSLYSIRQDSMLCASADRSVIGFEESNISDGRWGLYRVSTGEIVLRQGYTDGTSAFNYEIGVNRNGTQYSLPTYMGTYVYDSTFTKVKTLGVYAGQQPIGVAYSPISDIIYLPWAGTTEVRAFNTKTWEQTGTFSAASSFTSNGNNAFSNGRTKVSSDGKLLFVTVDGGVQIFDTVKPQAPSVTSFAPTSGKAGTIVVIKGLRFDGTNAVSFNGQSATFHVDSSSQITAIAPSGVVTGRLAVTTPGGNAISAGNFVVDNTNPVVTITTPKANSTLYNGIPSIGGRVSDATLSSGLSRVDLQLYRLKGSSTLFWDGTKWNSKISVLPTSVTSSGSWSNSGPLPTGTNVAGGAYIISARAYDNVGNTALALNNLNVVLDTSAPQTSITAPTFNQFLSSLKAVEGQSVEKAGGSGLAKINLFIYRPNGEAETFEYWNGATWSGARTPISFTASAIGTWKSTKVPGDANMPMGVYYVKAQTVDKAGNGGNTSYIPFFIGLMPMAKTTSTTQEAPEFPSSPQF